ncbi:L-fucose:H+ symporter permease [Lentilactobacillus buchneri]|uniref:L-fucose:H+ symporter permease n=1 Tax=Lentilactobacillus buchneri TaxID=1581 RepID=UPI0021A8429F|nr:L-fucose:H+ symporter permease [Lentilactobacillus buchneri]MCT3559163.1 L-fucose:H+ symporter permease [Lentilactobacillus buchneri]
MDASKHVVEKKHGWTQFADGYLEKTPIFQFILISLIFPLWGAAASLNDILITQFKSVFMLNDAATAFVQSAFYGGYFLIAIPASLVIKKQSYKFAIMTGLIFYIVGCAMFFPASRVATYTMFLAAIFAIAVGLSFLETSCDTYSSMLGPRKFANIRLNISQTLVPLGDMAGIILGKYLIFGSVGNLSETMSHMHGAERIAYGEKMLQLTLQPYKYILVVLIAILIILAITPMPKSKAVSLKEEEASSPSLIETIKYLAKNYRFKKGIMAQFFYVGMQTTVWSFTIRLALNLNTSISDSNASTFMIYSYAAWFVGKLCANFLMKDHSVTGILTIFSALGTVTLILATTIPNMTAVWMAIAASFFFGPEWPTIYAHTLDTIEDKRFTETGGAIIVMAIVGGAVIPAIQGLVSDMTGSMQTSFIVPTLCYVIVTIYFFFEYRYDLSHPDQITENQ